MIEQGPDNPSGGMLPCPRMLAARNDATVASHGEPRAGGLEFALDAIPGCRLFEEIHRGAQGVVYRALQCATGREVAVKVMRRGPFADAEDRARFDREVRILAQLKHPHIVTVHDAGVAADCHYFVMEYIPGQPLHEYVQRRRPRVRDVLELFVRICDAVDAAHQKGIVHRDLKPGNILVDHDGAPHIVDFGLARSISPGEELLETTQPGRFLGTLVYAAPEQARGAAGELVPQTDVYALGVMLYEILAGERPYQFTGNLSQALFTITDAVPVPLRRRDKRLHPDLETILMRCLSKDPAQRYPTAGLLARDLERYLHIRPLALTPHNPLHVAGLALGRMLQRRPRVGYVGFVLAVSLVIAVAAGLISDGLPVVRRPLETKFERSVFSRRHPALAARMLDTVRVIALQPNTDVDQIVAAAGVSGVDPRADPQALRAAHGALMRRLAVARPAVVAWNIEFHRDSPYDDAFVAGVDALRAVGCETAVAANRWSLAQEGLPELSAAILKTCHWGHTPIRYPQGTAWRVPLALQRRLDDPIPSLALVVRVVTELPAPEARYDVRVDAAYVELSVAYWRPSPTQPRAKEPLSARVPPLRASVFEIELNDNKKYGVDAGDRLIQCFVVPPPDAVLQACTFDYAQVFALSDDECRRLFAGKYVVVGDMRAADQFFATLDGRRVWNTYGLATTLATLIENNAIRQAGPLWQCSAVWLAALTGCLLGTALYRRLILRLPAALGAAALLMLGAWLVGWQGHVLWHPIHAVVVLLCAAELAARNYALYRKRIDWNFVPQGVMS